MFLRGELTILTPPSLETLPSSIFLRSQQRGGRAASILAETPGLELGTSSSKVTRFFQYEPNCWILQCWRLAPCSDQPGFPRNTQELEQVWATTCAGEHPEQLEFVAVTAWAQEQSPCFWSKWYSPKNGRTENFMGRRRVRKLSSRKKWENLGNKMSRWPFCSCPVGLRAPTGQLNPNLSVRFGPVNSHVRVISCITGGIVCWPGERVALCLLWAVHMDRTMLSALSCFREIEDEWHMPNLIFGKELWKQNSQNIP